jgi:hypothetical protein
MEVLESILGGAILLASIFIFALSANYRKIIHYLVMITTSVLFALKAELRYLLPVFIIFVLTEYMNATDFTSFKYVSGRANKYLKVIRILLLSTLSILGLVLISDSVEATHIETFSLENEYIIIVAVIFCIIDSLQRRKKWKY